MFGSFNRFRIGTIGGHEIAIDPIALAIFAYFLFSQPDRQWAAAVFVAAFLSVLVHELGHAFAIKGLLGQDAVVVVFGFGGYTYPKPPDIRSLASLVGPRRPRTAGQQILISLAGPGAGFVLGLAGWLVVRLASVESTGPLPWQFTPGASIWLLALWWVIVASLAWGALNLVPAYPLDGGQAFRAVLRKMGLSADRAGRYSRRLGLVLWAAAGILGYLYWRDMILVAFAAWFFFLNISEARREGF